MAYEALTTTGGLIVDPKVQVAKLLRCVSCGATGNANLCSKCFALHLDALDIHTDGLFSALILAWKDPANRKPSQPSAGMLFPVFVS